MRTLNIESLPTETTEPLKVILDILTNTDETVVVKENGKAIYIIDNGIVKKTEDKRSIRQNKSKRIPGTAEGQIWIANDFDELPEDMSLTFDPPD